MRIPRPGRSPIDQPPGPRGSFGIGNLAAYEADRLGYLLSLREEYGPVVRLGSRTTVINDPGLALQVLRDRSGSFGVRESFLQQRLERGEMSQRLAPRPLLNAALRPNAIHGIASLLVPRLIAEIDAVRSRGWTFDPVPVLERALSRALAEFYFGAGAEDIAARIGALLDELGRVIGNPFALPGWIGSPTRRRIDQRYHDVLDVVVPALVRRAARPREYADAAGAIMASNDGRHPIPRVADMVIGALLAGHRVPAAGGAWLLLLIADQPRFQDAVRAQMPGTTGHAAGTSDVLNRMVLECLRLYPPTWMVARTAETAVDVAGWRFRRRHNFLISPYVIHRDEAVFPDSSRFRPERWRTARPHQTAFLAFGAGVHLCPGRSLAQSVLSTALAAILSRYRVERVPGPVIADPRTTLLPAGLQIRLTPFIDTGRPELRAALAGNAQAPALFAAASP